MQCAYGCTSGADAYLKGHKKRDIKMDVDLIFQVAGVGIIVTVINQLLARAGRDEQALLVTITGLVVVLFMLTQEIGNLFDSVKRIFGL